MTTVDNRTFLASGGYLQKGRVKNVRAQDLGQKIGDLLPSRYFRDEKIYQLERRSIFATVNNPANYSSSSYCLKMNLVGFGIFEYSH